MIAPHAVPQNILDVEFKLFGSLTVKQFSYLAGATFAALIFYFIFGSLPWLMWPLILVCIGVGLALALIKINQRPFDVWLTNYILAVMGSQRSIYHKSKKSVNVLDSLNLGKNDEILDEKLVAKIEEPKSIETSFMKYNDDKRNILDLEETGKLGRLNDLFREMSVPSSVSILHKTETDRPNLGAKQVPTSAKIPVNNFDVIERNSQEVYIKSNSNGIIPKRKVLNENDLEVIKSLRAHLAQNLEKSIAEKRNHIGNLKKSKK